MTTGRRAVRPFGDAALLVAAADAREARSLAAAAAGVADVREVVGGVRSVLVTVDPGRDRRELADLLADLDPLAVALPAPRELGVPATFGGPDSRDVCRFAGITENELIELLTGAVLEVSVLGFSPISWRRPGPGRPP